MVSCDLRDGKALLKQHLKEVLRLEGVSDPRGTLLQDAVATCGGACTKSKNDTSYTYNRIRSKVRDFFRLRCLPGYIAVQYVGEWTESSNITKSNQQRSKCILTVIVSRYQCTYVFLYDGRSEVSILLLGDESFFACSIMTSCLLYLYVRNLCRTWVSETKFFKERVRCITQFADLSFDHSIGLTHSWRFSFFYRIPGIYNKRRCKAVCCAGLFCWGCKQRLFLLRNQFLPRKERKSSRLFSEWVWLLSERYPDQFSASRESQLREFRTSSFVNVVVRKLEVDQDGGSVWSFLFFWKTILEAKKTLFATSKNKLPQNKRPNPSSTLLFFTVLKRQR